VKLRPRGVSFLPELEISADAPAVCVRRFLPLVRLVVSSVRRASVLNSERAACKHAPLWDILLLFGFRNHPRFLAATGAFPA